MPCWSCQGASRWGGLSRWAGHGGRYRTVPRVCSTVLPWATRLWVCGRQPLYRPGDVYWLAMPSWSPQRVNTRMVWIDSGSVCTASQCQGSPASRDRGAVPRHGARVRCTSRRWCAVTWRRPPARPKRQPSRSNWPPTSVAAAVPRAVSTTTRPKSHGPQSWGGSTA